MKKKLFLISTLVFALLLAGCGSLFDGKLPKENTNFPVTKKISYETLVEGIDYKAGEVLVRLGSSVMAHDMVRSFGASTLQTFDEIGWALVSVPVGMTAIEFINELESQEFVVMAEPNLTWTLPEPGRDLFAFDFDAKEEPIADEYYKLWGMENIRADEAWDITIGSDKVIVVVADTGLDLGHPEFAEHTILNPHNTAGDEDSAWDMHGHGTHVMGTAAADGRYGKLAGVVWDCPIMPIRVMDYNGYMYNTYIGQSMLNVAAYLDEHSEYRAVVNMSLGGRGYSHFMKDCIDYAYAKGILLVAAAGNDTNRVASFPANYSGVVSVAASTPHDKKADFSTKGWWNSVAAPGVEIWSAYPTYGGVDYTSMQGTSMACPHVCGAVAMLLSEKPNLTPLEIKNQLEQTVRPGYYGNEFTEELGFGIIDCVDMLGTLKPMKYGSLKVVTDLELDEPIPGSEHGYDYGIITIFNTAGNIIYFGSTGFTGTHNFWAMNEGVYTVTVSYKGAIKGKKQVTIIAGTEQELQFSIISE